MVRKKFLAKNFFGSGGWIGGWLPGGRGVEAEGQLECLDIPFTSTYKAHLPLRPQISQYYTSPGGWGGGWPVGQSVRIRLYSYLSPAKLGLRLSLAKKDFFGPDMQNRKTQATQVVFIRNKTSRVLNKMKKLSILEGVLIFLVLSV